MSRVNIITAYYNTDLELFKRSLKTVPRDTHHIIVDDGSTNFPNDNYYKSLDDFVYLNCENFNFNVLRLEKNSGPGAARNLAFKNLTADCEYICFLDSDDRLAFESVEKRVFALDVLRKLSKNTVAVYGDKYNLDVRNNKNAAKILEKVPDFDRVRFMNECFVPSNSMLFRRDIFDKYICKMNEDIRLAEDYNLWLKLATLGHIVKIDIPVYTQVLHGNNLTLQSDVLANHWHDLQMCHQDFECWLSEIKKNVQNK